MISGLNNDTHPDTSLEASVSTLMHTSGTIDANTLTTLTGTATELNNTLPMASHSR